MEQKQLLNSTQKSHLTQQHQLSEIFCVWLFIYWWLREAQRQPWLTSMVNFQKRGSPGQLIFQISLFPIMVFPPFPWIHTSPSHFPYYSKIIEKSIDVSLFVCFYHVTYVFGVSLHSVIAWMPRNTLLKTCAITES